MSFLLSDVSSFLQDKKAKENIIISVAKPNKEIINKISTAYNCNLEVGIKKLSSFNFDLPAMVSKKGKISDNKDLKNLREFYLVKVECKSIDYVEWFQIQDIEPQGSSEDYYSISCRSLPKELSQKLVRDFNSINNNLYTVTHQILEKSHWTLATTLNAALRFDGNAVVNVIDTGFVNFSGNKGTIEMWVYEEDSPNWRVGIKQEGNNLFFGRKSVGIGDTVKHIKAGGAGREVSDELPSMDEREKRQNTYYNFKWTHWAMTFTDEGEIGEYENEKVVRLYADGVLFYETIFSGGIGDIDNFYLGGVEENFLKGNIDEVRFWNICRERENISEYMHTRLYNLDKEEWNIKNQEDLIAYWIFNEREDPIKDRANDYNFNISDIEGIEWSDNYLYFRGDQAATETDFLFKFREIEITESNIIDSILNNISSRFGAVPIFDTFNRQLSYVKLDDIGRDRGIKIKRQKLLDNVNKANETTDFCTRLYPYGSDNLTIARQSPTGQPFIENFSFFLYPYEEDEEGNVIKHSYYMSDGLAKAIIAYQEEVSSKEGQIKSNLDEIETLFRERVSKENDLFSLETDLGIVQNNLDVERAKKEENQDSTLIGELENEKEDLQDDIDELQNEIGNIEDEINNKYNNIHDIREQLNVESFFNDFFDGKEEEAEDILKERESFIIEKTTTNEYITNEEDLYEWAVQEFEIFSKPQLKVDIDLVNFIELIEYEYLWKGLELGDTIRIQYDILNIDIKARIMEMSFDFESASMNMTIANVERVKKEGDKFLESLQDSISTSTEVSKEKPYWKEAHEKASEHDSILEGEWDATRRMIQAAGNQSVEISSRGLIIREPEHPERYLIAQSGVLAIADDDPNTEYPFRHAIRHDGIVGERLFGKVIFSEELNIQNDENNPRITMNEDGIKGVKDGDVKFHLKSDGDAEFSGTLSAVSGSFESLNTSVAGARFELGSDPNFAVYDGDEQKRLQINEDVLKLYDPYGQHVGTVDGRYGGGIANTGIAITAPPSEGHYYNDVILASEDGSVVVRYSNFRVWGGDISITEGNQLRTAKISAVGTTTVNIDDNVDIDGNLDVSGSISGSISFDNLTEVPSFVQEGDSPSFSGLTLGSHDTLKMGMTATRVFVEDDGGNRCMTFRTDIGSSNENSIRLDGLDSYTTGEDPNVYISSYENIIRSTADISESTEIMNTEDGYSIQGNSYAEQFLTAEVIKQYKSMRPGDLSEDGSYFSTFGYISDEVAKIHPCLAQYNKEGEPKGLNLSRIVALLHKSILRNRKYIDDLERKVEELERK